MLTCRRVSGNNDNRLSLVCYHSKYRILAHNARYSCGRLATWCISHPNHTGLQVAETREVRRDAGETLIGGCRLQTGHRRSHWVKWGFNRKLVPAYGWNSKDKQVTAMEKGEVRWSNVKTLNVCIGGGKLWRLGRTNIELLFMSTVIQKVNREYFSIRNILLLTRNHNVFLNLTNLRAYDKRLVQLLLVC